jgi:hypothetical protein
MTERQVRHPLFARMYDRMSVADEAKGVAEHREELIQLPAPPHVLGSARRPEA